LLAAAFMGRTGHSYKEAKVKVPWFIFLFCLAAAAATYLPRFAAQYGTLSHLGKAGLTATLFLIGTSLSKKTLQQVGVRPFVQGVSLWIIVAGVSLAGNLFQLHIHLRGESCRRTPAGTGW
jgi:uncharacterized membrane protein YadS